MRPVKRTPVSKRREADRFKAHVGRTRKINMAPPPMRGGYRL